MELRLKQERIRRQWTQEEVAKKMRVSNRTISAWENGSRSPRRRQLDELENLFGLSQRELFSTRF